MMGARDWALIAGVAAASWALVGIVRHYALRRGVLDAPKERSSHVVPTPRGGGLGLAIAAAAGYLIAAPHGGRTLGILLALAAVIPTAVVGWMDDHRSLPAAPRLAAQLLTSLMLIPLGTVGFGVWAAAALAVAWIFATIAAINVVNFMDGLDGLIGLQALVFGIHLALLANPGSPAYVLSLSLAAASLGFLIWNWSPGRIFLGDVGSGAIAVMGLIGGIMVWREGNWPFLAVFLPLFALFLDATVILVGRVLRGEDITVAHRNHLYQRLANELRWGHARVSLLFGVAAATATMVVLSSPREQLALTPLAYAGVTSIVGWWLDRRTRSPGASGEGGGG